MKNTDNNRMLSISEAVSVMGLCKTSLYNEIKIGRIAAKKFGNRTLISSIEIDKWINDLPEMNNNGGKNEN